MVGRRQILHWLGVDSPTSRTLLVLKLAVFLDMVGVGLYVPLLPFYWRELGVKTELLGLVASVYQISQIVSGVVLGYVSDHMSGRKNILLLSFLGSAVSYALAGLSYQNSLISTLVLSRFIVGLVKQTMTISRAITTSLTTDEDRTRSLSHLRACATLAFLVGPTMGGLLSKTFNKAVPAYAAAALFVLNALMVQIVLPNDISSHAHPAKEKKEETEEEEKKEEEKRKTLVRSNSTGAVQGIRDLLEKEGLGSLTLIKFLNSVFVAACHVFSSKYVTEKYELEPHHMGYLSSYQSLVSLASQTYLVAAISKRFGEERTLQAAFLCWKASLSTSSSMLR
ncbi:hypothetical protein GUITHDRAFT_135376 [Guillardia theta CCMP2712]|uniref:Major facilitator superfamily (MFS) profile domain-containing protein n=1 Tax=Guillardia theta (strain CCMP2712) TaxID=905079 RepID=L1JPT6_GUITC|nr:hypothetical protein GUITHDRAFT_135376 [Guillardia theta CCMP2712]EKX50205.1 hypothetical protein GUITHDRAFT_135376 [Guillardia theta CCMP2712]|eukprot:XP_005837185.1 hypothetical protein GUITHDRAFT_135376 [Guillardia theta CCMP2712]